MELAFTCRFWHKFIMNKLNSSVWRVFDIDNDMKGLCNINLLKNIPGGLVKKMILGSVKDNAIKPCHFDDEVLKRMVIQDWNQIMSLGSIYFL